MGNTPFVELVRRSETAVLPKKGSEHAVGWDVCADESVWLAPGEHAMIDTGWDIGILDYDREVQVRPRSGLAAKHGITVLNSPGTIDPDYRGPLKVILINHGSDEFFVEKGMRIAQLVLASVVREFDYFDGEKVEVYKEVDKFMTETERGEGGFGSTGV